MSGESEQKAFFVYGTLLMDFHNAHLMGRDAYRTVAYLSCYAMLDNGWFPYVVPTGSTCDVVEGEIVLVSPASYDRVLRDLDRLEGFHGQGRANHYERVPEKVTCEDGSVLEAWVYVAGSRVGGHLLSLPRVESGSWRQREHERLGHAEFSVFGEDD